VTLWVFLAVFFGLGAVAVFAVTATEDQWGAAFGAVGVYLVSAFVTFWPLTAGWNPDYSSGMRDGLIVRAAHKGAVWRSHEFSMNVGELATSSTWDFSATDQAVITTLKTSVGKRCRVYYREWMMAPRYLETSYEADRVECK
jgi:hypothetical protein